MRKCSKRVGYHTSLAALAGVVDGVEAGAEGAAEEIGVSVS